MPLMLVSASLVRLLANLCLVVQISCHHVGLFGCAMRKIFSELIMFAVFRFIVTLAHAVDDSVHLICRCVLLCLMSHRA